LSRRDAWRFEWVTILRVTAAAVDEIKDVPLRMGRVWR
jgi:hypothetical protein